MSFLLHHYSHYHNSPTSIIIARNISLTTLVIRTTMHYDFTIAFIINYKGYHHLRLKGSQGCKVVIVIKLYLNLSVQILVVIVVRLIDFYYVILCIITISQTEMDTPEAYFQPASTLMQSSSPFHSPTMIDVASSNPRYIIVMIHNHYYNYHHHHHYHVIIIIINSFALDSSLAGISTMIYYHIQKYQFCSINISIV